MGSQHDFWGAPTRRALTKRCSLPSFSFQRRILDGSLGFAAGVSSAPLLLLRAPLGSLLGFSFCGNKTSWRQQGGTGLATSCHILEPLVGEGGGGERHQGAELPGMGLAPGFIWHLLPLTRTFPVPLAPRALPDPTGSWLCNQHLEQGKLQAETESPLVWEQENPSCRALTAGSRAVCLQGSSLPAPRHQNPNTDLLEPGCDLLKTQIIQSGCSSSSSSAHP